MSLYRKIFQICIGPNMFSWIRHYVAEACTLPSALSVCFVIRMPWEKQRSPYWGAFYTLTWRAFKTWEFSRIICCAFKKYLNGLQDVQCLRGLWVFWVLETFGTFVSSGIFLDFWVLRDFWDFWVFQEFRVLRGLNGLGGLKRFSKLEVFYFCFKKFSKKKKSKGSKGTFQKCVINE